MQANILLVDEAPDSLRPRRMWDQWSGYIENHAIKLKDGLTH